MTSIEKLRFLLAQNGIECGETGIGQLYWSCGPDTWYAKSLQGDVLSIEAVMTPEDVLYATLRLDTCEMKPDLKYGSDFDWHCSVCNEHVSTCDAPPRFCPGCGRKVKQ